MYSYDQLSEMGITNLKKIAKDLGIKGYYKWKKTDKSTAIDAILQANQNKEIGSPRPPPIVEENVVNVEQPVFSIESCIQYIYEMLQKESIENRIHMMAPLLKLVTNTADHVHPARVIQAPIEIAFNQGFQPILSQEVLVDKGVLTEKDIDKLIASLLTHSQENEFTDKENVIRRCFALR